MAISSLASSGSNVNVIFWRLFFAYFLLFNVTWATISLFFAFSSLYSFLMYKTTPTLKFLSITTPSLHSTLKVDLTHLGVGNVSVLPPTVFYGGGGWYVAKLVAGRRTSGCGCGGDVLLLETRAFGLVNIKKRVQ